MNQSATQNRHSQLVPVLAKIREEWQQAAAGESLLNMDANVGLMLADIVNSLGLSTQDQALVLGKELLDELNQVLAVH
jgi:hypothetical protein